jgi:hypothetical protein
VHYFQLYLATEPEPKQAPVAPWELAAQIEKPAAGFVAQTAVEEAEAVVAERALDAAASAVVEAGRANLKVDVALAAAALAHFAAYSN